MTNKNKLASLRQPQRAMMFCCSLSLFFTPNVFAETYDEMIIQARAGHTDHLLGYLADYSTKHPLSAEKIADWLQVASWINDDDLVIQVWDKYQHQEGLPPRAYAAIAASERNKKRWSASIQHWNAALQTDRTHVEYINAKSMTEADGGRFTLASQTAAQLNALGEKTQYQLLIAYIQLRKNQPYDALFSATQAQVEAPNDRQVQQRLTDLYSINRLTQPALHSAEQLHVSPAALRAKQLEYAAGLVRNALIQTDNQQERFQTADHALSYYHDLFDAWHNPTEVQQDVLRARIDRLGALLARERYDEIIKEYQQLIKQGHAIPDYAKPWVAAALLAQKLPDQALTLLPAQQTQALIADDNLLETVFYSLLESDDPEGAGQLLARKSAQTPWKKRVWGLPLQQPNDTWLNLQALKIDYLLAIQDYPAAEQLSHTLATSAPGNQDLAIRYASVLSARGLDRDAEKVLKRAESVSPDNKLLETEQAYNAANLQEWHQLESLTDDLVARAPSAPSIKQLNQYRQLQHRWELQVGVNKGLHSQSPVAGSHDVNVTTRLYTPPIATHYRVFAGYQFEQSRFEEGQGQAQTPSLGVEWRGRDNLAEVEVNHQRITGRQHTGFRFSGWHDFNDHWRLSAQAARFSTEAPLRARRNNVSADSAGLSLRWFHNERREYQLSLLSSTFSDGNHRLEYQLSGKERLWTSPHLTLDFTPEISASQNSKQNVAYYSPKNDLALLPKLTLEHQIYQHYDRTWSQQMTAGSGIYTQHNEPTGTITQLGYGQNIKWNQRLETGVMVIWGRQPWDGRYENNLSAQLDMTLRF